jgi:hypothetical protein
MKRKYGFGHLSTVFLFIVLLIIFLSGCPSDGGGVGVNLASGTVTVHISGAAEQNGTEVFIAMVYPGDDPAIYEDQIAGATSGLHYIVDGEYVMIMRWHESETIAVFDGGQYELGLLLDVNTAGGSGIANSGDYYLVDYVFTVDGNITIELSYPTDFTLLL